MTRTLVFLAAALAASQAHAATIRVYLGAARDTEHSAYRDFMISTSPTAYLALPAATELHDFTAADGASVAALFADMTNGVNDPLTFATSTASYTVDEDYFFTDISPGPPLSALSGVVYPPAVDLVGWTIDRITVSHTFSDDLRRYHFEAWAHVPEPSSGLLLVGMCGLLAHLRMGPRRPSTVN